jgi:hypothetical protein
MSDKRFKRFNRELSSQANNPYFSKIRDLYVNNIIKNIPSAEKNLKGIRITNKKVLYKTSIRKAEEIDKKYNILQGPNILNKNKIKEKTITITKKNIDNYGVSTHYDQFKNMMDKVKNAYYIQVVKFYNKHNKLSTHQPYITKVFKTIEKIKTEKYKTIQFSMELDYQWLVELWIEDNKTNYATITTTAYKNIAQVQNINVEQLYQENESGTCVYDGFLKFFNQDCKKKKTIYNKLIKNKSIYAKAYTDETLKEICDFTQSTLIIKDLIKGKNKIIKTDNARYTINFLNTKYNHLDLLMHSYDDNIIECKDKDELETIKNKSEFYIESYGELITLDGKYKVKDDDFKVEYKKWKEEINYSDLLINDNNEELTLIKAYDYSTHCFFNNYEVNNNLYDELDIEKAYFNYSNKKKNPNYHGVPSGSFINLKCEDNFNINIFNKQLENNLIGFYQVIIQKIHNSSEIFNKLGIFENKTYVFTSVQINVFKEYISFKFLNVSISPSVDIPFPESFKNKIGGLSYYCKAYGLLMASSDFISLTVKPLLCDLKYYSIIQDEDLKMYEFNGIIKINNKNDTIKTGIHIANYIHSYTKILIFQQLLKVNINDVFGIKIDSIVIKKDAVINKLLPCFHKDFKPCNIEKMLKGQINQNTNIKWYVSELDGHLTYNENYIENDDDIINQTGYYRSLFRNTNEIINFKSSFLPDNEMITSNVIFLSGKGGSGKSHSILSNLNNVCMVSTCWNLSQAKKEDYPSLKPLSINKLVGENCEKVEVSNKILLLDELTMWNKKDILQCIKDYKRKFIFMAGDINYNGEFFQCNINNSVINPSTIKNVQFVTYIKNYRFDNELNNILDGLRNCKTKKEQTDYINIYFKNNFKNKEDIIFDDKTIGISDLDDTKLDNELTNYFISKGTKPQYYIKETKNGQYKGARIDEIPTHNNYESKLFKTIHSFQGLDLKRDEKIVISNKKNFDFNLWYTAFSRARRLDQIIILNN